MFWLNGRNENTVKQSFAGMASRLYNEYPTSAILMMAEEEQDINQAVAFIKQWLSVKENTRWILVFDNIDNLKLPGIKEPQGYEIRLYFPEAHQGHILITTRSARLDIGKVISVEKFHDIEECIAIIGSISRREDLDQGAY